MDRARFAVQNRESRGKLNASVRGVPPTGADAAAYAARRAAAAKKPGTENPQHRIELRRFAGPVAYLEQIAHLRIAHLTDQHVRRGTPMGVPHSAADQAN